jgi:putative ABC transport system permease protein
MSLWKLVKNNLVFYWRTNLGVLLAVVVSAAILTGALVVGDSVSYSLQRMVKARLGKTTLALVPQNRFFRAELANELVAKLNTTVAPVLKIQGMISNDDGTKRANKVEVLGIDVRFFKVGAEHDPFNDNWESAVVLNEPLASRLNVGPCDEIVLRIEKPSVMSRDIPLTPDSDMSIAFRLKVKAIATESEFGRFSLQANQVASLNVFVPLQWLQETLDRGAQANMLLVAENLPKNITVDAAKEAILKCWELADAEIEFRQYKQRKILELRSRRVFIDSTIADAALDESSNSLGILTYFVNELRLRDKATPYSMVAAVGHDGLIPKDMQDDEILINQWLADDLEAKAGDVIELTYFVLSQTKRLQEQKSSFRVKAVLPMNNPAMDPNLMPDFPGLSDAENCRDWDPGVAIDLDKIRTKDEDYWEQYRGTPKAFITLTAGQKLWANRYGNLTAVRYPLGGEPEDTITKKILNSVNPASVGLFFQPVRARGIRAGNQATDFGQLFLSLSMFLIIAALILVGLLFVFGVESRNEQVGMFLAVGLSPKLIKWLLFIEGVVLALLGAIVGTVVGLFYTKAMIYGLATIWQAAITGSKIYFYAKPSTLFIGMFAAVAVSLFAIWLTLRKQVSKPARELLTGGLNYQPFTQTSISGGRVGLYLAIVASIAAVILVAVMGTGDSSSVSTAFFGAGTLLLIAGLGLCYSLLKIAAGSWNKVMTSLTGLGLRNSTRRSGRSLAVVGLLACGVFMVISVGANRRNPEGRIRKRDSGTGGFTLLGESTISILYDLDSRSGRREMGLDDGELDEIKVVQMRVLDGDDASCLNLNRAQMPRLLGVQPDKLQERSSFVFTKTINDTEAQGWDLLNSNLGQDVIPAVSDYATIIWGLGKSVGDELEYIDEKGQTFRVRLVGMLKNTILQGSIIISEDEFIKRFPSEDGYRLFLIDTAGDKIETVNDRLSSQLRDFGLSLTSTKRRLAEFNAVQNMYLSIFQLLGTFGLILGSMGLGLVVLRNVLERRGELAMMQAVGFNKHTLKRMVLYEHSGLLVAGLACGIIAALIAVGPALKSPGADVPFFSLTLTIVGIGISGLAWIWFASTFALGGEMLEALRNE